MRQAIVVCLVIAVVIVIGGCHGAGPEDDGYTSWSPDGSQIVFSSRCDGNGEIYVMDADGSSPIRLTNDPADDEYPA